MLSQPSFQLRETIQARVLSRAPVGAIALSVCGFFFSLHVESLSHPFSPTCLVSVALASVLS